MTESTHDLWPAPLTNAGPAIGPRRKSIAPYLRPLSMDPKDIAARERATEYRAREKEERDRLHCIGNVYLRSTTLEEAIPLALTEMDLKHSAPLDDRKGQADAVRHIVESWLRWKKSSRP